MIAYLVMVPVGYLLGSVPFGLIAGRLLKRVDIRELGSGNIGMTNVMRTVGVKAGVVVLLLDMGKSVGAIAIARAFYDSQGAEVGAGLAALVGHMWPVFVGFRGGRGTSPGWGALWILSPVAGAAATVAGGLMLGITRYVSLGSLIGATSGALALVILPLVGAAPFEYTWYGVIGAPLVLDRHRDNIQRLLKGTERKLGQRVEGPGGQPGPGEVNEGKRWPRSA